MVTNTTAVLRKDRSRNEIHMTEIIPGDIIYLAAGDMIPADCRIVDSIDLFISESMLTGESLPVERYPLPIPNASNERPTDLANLFFMGTNVGSGAASAIAIATGANTYFGNIGKSIIGESPEISFDIGINKVNVLLIRFMLIMFPVIF